MSCIQTFSSVSFEQIEIGNSWLQETIWNDSLIDLLSFVGSIRINKYLDSWNGHVLLGRSRIHGIVCWFGWMFTKIDRTFGRPSWCFPIELHRSYIDSWIQISPDSPLFLRPNYQQPRQRRSTQVAISPLQDAGWRSTSVSWWIALSFNSHWSDILNIWVATVFDLWCIQCLPNVIYDIQLDSLFFVIGPIQ